MKLESITILDQFDKAVKESKARISLTYGTLAYTWKELNLLSDKMAVLFLNLDIEKGMKVGIWSGNSPFWFAAYLAIMKIGAVSVLLNPNYKEYEAEWVLDYSDIACICVGDNQHNFKLEQINQKLVSNHIGYVKASIPIGAAAFQRLKKMPPPNKLEMKKLNDIRQRISPFDMASMLFTSGTTSRPKGIMLTHFQLINIARAATEAMHWNQHDRVCLSLPLFHSFGLSTGFLAALVHGGSIHLGMSYHSTDVIECIEQNRCTVLNGVPAMFLAVLRNKKRETSDLSSLDSGIIAGAGIYKKDFLKISKTLNIKHLMQSYGQTEASPSITFSDFEDSLKLRAESVGRPVEHMKLRIIERETGKEAKPGIPGEIQIMGYNVMQGYYKAEQETKAIMTEDGWMNTGDIGYVDKENHVYIIGRIRDIIIRSGENISPKEIEELILESEHVDQVKVFGVSEEVVQEEIAACIESRNGKASEYDIRNRIVKCLADYKMPKYIFMYPKFPLNATGKVDINALKQDILAKIKEVKQ